MKTKSNSEWNNILTKDFLYNEYVVLRKNTFLIAKEQKCGIRRIREKIKEYNFSRKRQSNNKRMDVPLLLERAGFSIVGNYNGNKFINDIKCYCGNVFKTTPAKILKGHTKSCGCLYQTKQYHKGYKDISKKEFNRIIYGAKKRNIKFSLTIEELWEIYESQNKKCKLTNMDLYWDSKVKLGNASVDRIDNLLGYEKSNIQIIHKDVNMMKRHHSQDFFIYMCYLIGKNYKNKDSFYDWENNYINQKLNTEENNG